MKRIRVVIDRKGKATVEAFGFEGGDCLLATQTILMALGGDVTTLAKEDDITTQADATVSQS